MLASPACSTPVTRSRVVEGRGSASGYTRLHHPGRKRHMPAATVPKNALALGAGYLYFANLGTSLPANTVAGSVFTDAWPAGWNEIGITKTGSEFDYTINVSPIDSAEFFDPVQWVMDSREAALKMELEQISATNMKFALNGGSLLVSGSGRAELNSFKPPSPGSEVPIIVGLGAPDKSEKLLL